MSKWANLLKKEVVGRTVISPDGRIAFGITLRNNRIYYDVSRDGRKLVEKSQLAFELFGEGVIDDDLKLAETKSVKHQETIEMMWGEDRYICNDYFASEYLFRERGGKHLEFMIEVRVFDAGVALRYVFPEQAGLKRFSVKNEHTEFNFPAESTAWHIPAYQPDRYEYNYEKTLLGELDGSAHTPFTLRTPDGVYVAIHEAALYDYGAMNLMLGQNGVLVSDITPLSDHSKAHIVMPFATPWRVIMIADSAASLTENRMIYCLNDAPKGDFSWVKTLKFIGIWWAMYVGEWTWAPGEKHGATTEHAKEYIDAAVKLGIAGLLIEGWNEGAWEGDWLENGATSDFSLATADFDLPAVARYAASHGIEIVGHHETVGFVDNYERQLERAYNYYAANGVHYIKTGYAGSKMHINGRDEYHHSQVGVRHYQKTVELAARKHICLDIHEPIKGTGIERTWPNLLTREGARGQEYEGGALAPSHACNLPFTRLLAGGMDYTPGIFDILNGKKRIFTTLARQLAYYVTIYSGMAMAADRPFVYEKYPEVFEFIREVPTNFEKTIALGGEIGEYYIVARKDRDSDDWYVGGVTTDTKEVDVVLRFLDDGAYNAKIYQDGAGADYNDNPLSIDICERKVEHGSSLHVRMAAGGGFAMRLTKIIPSPR